MLHRIDPDWHVARFYSLMIERDLFGVITLVRTWGRERVEAYDTVDEAGRAFEALARVKRRRGYRDL